MGPSLSPPPSPPWWFCSSFTRRNDDDGDKGLGASLWVVTVAVEVLLGIVGIAGIAWRIVRIAVHYHHLLVFVNHDHCLGRFVASSI